MRRSKLRPLISREFNDTDTNIRLGVRGSEYPVHSKPSAIDPKSHTNSHSPNSQRRLASSDIKSNTGTQI